MPPWGQAQRARGLWGRGPSWVEAWWLSKLTCGHWEGAGPLWLAPALAALSEDRGQRKLVTHSPSRTQACVSCPLTGAHITLQLSRPCVTEAAPKQEAHVGRLVSDTQLSDVFRGSMKYDM